jgi:predicted DNA-binding ribbon-helix-helix protein
MLSKRVEVLFDPKQYSELEQVAHRDGKSVGALIREAVEKQLLQPTRRQKLAAVRRITSQQMEWPPWDQLKEEIVRSKVGSLDAG